MAPGGLTEAIMARNGSLYMADTGVTCIVEPLCIPPASCIRAGMQGRVVQVLMQVYTWILDSYYGRHALLHRRRRRRRRRRRARAAAFATML
jgi:hypothetical protein|eukprot:COSAG01_NODE_14514_length_1444_cov_546.772491_2_plen_92_part_00